jgi:hypothetical protein
MTKTKKIKTKKVVMKSIEWIEFACKNDPLFNNAVAWLKTNYGEVSYEKLLAIIAAERCGKIVIY